MNERINELSLKAITIVMNGTDPDGDVERMYIPSEFTKKFAELIVAQCLAFVEPMPGSGDIDDLALEAARDQIKQHFGVEE